MCVPRVCFVWHAPRACRRCSPASSPHPPRNHPATTPPNTTTKADFDNFRRRTATEKAGLASKATADAVGALLPLLDAFELARTQLKVETEGEERINASYQGLYKQTVDILKGLGVEPVPTVGTPFDPELHDAIAREASDDVADGTVLVSVER